MKKTLLAICIWVLMNSATHASTLNFKDHGKSKDAKPTEHQNLEAAAPPQSWTVLEPHEKRERAYRVLPFNQLMDHVYGPKWRAAEEILFTCSDGYQPSIPTEKFLKYEAGLAFPTNANDPFELTNTLQNNEKVALGPYYLIWNNTKSPELRREGASDMPYQVVGIDLIEFAERFPKLYPGKNSSTSVKKGFVQFRKHCFSCHTINGEGGGKAPELNIPMNVTEYWQAGPLKQWLLEPSSVRWNTVMPGLNVDLPDRKKVADQILDYLKAMAKHKKKPGGK